MKRRLALLVAIAVMGVAAAGPGLAAGDRAGAAPAKACRGYVRGVIGGRVKCLRRGEYCALRYRSQYIRYGFHCLGAPARLR